MARFESLAAVFALTLAWGYGAKAVDFAVNGKVDIIRSLTVTESTELDFGEVSDNDGTVTLSLADTISSDPSGIHAGGTVASGEYTITGEPKATVSVVLAGSTTNGLTIDHFATSEPDLSSVSLGPGGFVVLTIGADLTISAAVAADGSDQPLEFTISVAYN
jgi:hypothetical protein